MMSGKGHSGLTWPQGERHRANQKEEAVRLKGTHGVAFCFVFNPCNSFLPMKKESTSLHFLPWSLLIICDHIIAKLST